MSELQKAILRTLTYADVFNYPLTSEEIWRFLITRRRTNAEEIQRELVRMKADKKQIEADKEFYFLKSRKDIASIRKKRRRWSREKLRIAYRVARWLRIIPWVKMIAVTGSLAVENADEDDDIDLLLVASAHRLWLTRLLIVFLTEIITDRRRPNDKKIKDKICLNMFLDEGHLAIPRKERDLFTAHEVCQLRPLWSQHNTYLKFLQANSWVRRFLPNWKEDIGILRYYDIKRKKQKSPNILISQYHNIFSFLENLTYKFQLAYMWPRRTTEITDLGRIRFHPQDARRWVLQKYREKLKRLKIK